ncbi:GntR family transcriptional regulator [Frateuria aurantia]
MTVMQQTEDRLRRMILDMEIGPGERLSERGIEAELGASRSSVRTALFRLEADGLVRKDGRGWMVPAIDLEEIEQLFAYRELLELGALRQAGGHISPEEFAEIDALLASVNAEATPEEVEAAGRAFHVWIAALPGNAFISRGVADAMTRLQRLRWLENRPDHHGWDEHRAIVEALKGGQVEPAMALVRSHLHETRQRLLEALRQERRSLRARGARVLGR